MTLGQGIQIDRSRKFADFDPRRIMFDLYIVFCFLHFDQRVHLTWKLQTHLNYDFDKIHLNHDFDRSWSR